MESHYLQILIFIIVFFIILIDIKRITLYKNKVWVRLVVLLLMVHYLSFYGYFFYREFNGGILIATKTQEFFQFWSTGLRFHAVLTYLMIETYGLFRDMMFNRNGSKLC